MGCEEFLDAKPNTNLVVPDNLEDLRALLDNDVAVMGQDPSLHEISAGDFQTDEQVVPNLTLVNRNAYLWADDIFENTNSWDWQRPYQQIFYSNVVLDQLSSIIPPQADIPEWKDLKGAALFYRAYSLFNLARMFTMPYVEETSSSMLGLPIKLESNVNIPSERATLKETFSRILLDLEEAKDLLHERPVIKTRPSGHAVFAMLARVYHYMRDYENALLFSEKALAINGQLMDYNLINPQPPRPFTRLNEEVIFNSYFITNGTLIANPGHIDKELYQFYHVNDLRRLLFFNQPNVRGQASFRGNYMGDIRFFSGLANDEMLLIQAESSARLGDMPKALNSLNRLLKNRYLTGTFVALKESVQVELIQIILQERRKQLVYRGLRWGDLKRLSGELEFEVTLQRTVNGESYILPPGDVRMAFPIPQNEIQLSGLIQNPR